MKLLLKSATIVDPKSKHHGKNRDILISNGKIEKIGAKISDENAKAISSPNLHISPGWIDLRSNFRDPGNEEKEDIKSGLLAAARGGFTSVLLMPSTSPVMDNKASLEYALSRANHSVVQLLVSGAISPGMKGEQLSELYDMKMAGAVAFTDDKNSISNQELCLRALDYIRNFNGLMISVPHDTQLIPGGVMHEGKMSTELGMKGIPAIAETIRIQRDLDLLKYTGGRIHFSLISTKEGVDLIRKAKKEGLNVSCDVSASHLVFVDEHLVDFDANFKVIPPFRSKGDRKALIKAVKDGTIDAICSDHSPQDLESKQKEFENAAFGASTIEVVYSACIEAFADDEDAQSIITQKLHEGPSKILNLESCSVEEGQSSNITLFDPDKEWIFERKNISSKSVHSPFLSKQLKGRPIGVIREKKSSFFD